MTCPVDRFHNKNNLHFLPFSNPRYSENIILNVEPKDAHARSLRCFWLFVTPWTVCTRLLCPLNFPGKNTGVGCHFLRQGIFLTQGLNPVLPHCRQILYHQCHLGSKGIEKWVGHRGRICYDTLLLVTFTILTWETRTFGDGSKR